MSFLWVKLLRNWVECADRACSDIGRLVIGSAVTPLMVVVVALDRDRTSHLFESLVATKKSTLIRLVDVEDRNRSWSFL